MIRFTKFFDAYAFENIFNITGHISRLFQPVAFEYMHSVIKWDNYFNNNCMTRSKMCILFGVGIFAVEIYFSSLTLLTDISKRENLFS